MMCLKGPEGLEFSQRREAEKDHPNIPASTSMDGCLAVDLSEIQFVTQAFRISHRIE